MLYQCFSENEWIYPDTVLTGEKNAAALECARGASVSFQLLTDCVLSENTPLRAEWTGLPENVRATVYQLLPAYVSENSAADRLTTLDYESVKHFVTHQAPFDVYEITREVTDGILQPGRAGLYLRFDAAEGCVPDTYAFVLKLSLAGEEMHIPVTLCVHACCVPPVQKAGFHMVNWLKTEQLEWQHNVSFPSAEYTAVLDEYLKNELDMRNDTLMLPSGEPVRDENGRVVDFDFSHAVHVGSRALAAGMPVIMGGFVARFHVWNEPEHFLLWDKEAEVASFEGYRQLKLYFEKLWRVVNENGWLGRYQQCLVDEPQFQNSEHYRILSGICRKFMPGVPINDPVESCDLEGALEVWVVKQAIYEQYIEKFRRLQELGEEIWIYTCGFPGGSMMNRIIDLPLTVSRLPFWMSVAYGAKGFLHWGYNCHNKELEKDTCYWVDREEHIAYPAGNSMVVYPGAGRPEYGVRGHAQRTGAEDAELLCQLMEKDAAAARAIIAKVCTGFDEYDPAPGALESARHELLCALDAYC
ncbi:MAG: DUF4091 domain-containing protein [Oscillospiraceae bacterium]|nr:DUF4091 domain-containing protein [Oscillospiraceae bacterium]